MEEIKMAPHESLHLQELLSFKNLSLTKSVTMTPLAQDEELKEILEQNVNANEKHIKDLKSIIEKSKITLE